METWGAGPSGEGVWREPALAAALAPAWSTATQRGRRVARARAAVSEGSASSSAHRPDRARSSGGQSAALIRPRSLVRVQARPLTKD